MRVEIQYDRQDIALERIWLCSHYGGVDMLLTKFDFLNCLFFIYHFIIIQVNFMPMSC